MVTPTQILIGISLDPYDSKELLSWAIKTAAHPNDTIVATHVLVGVESEKRKSVKVEQSLFRRAKAFVISVLGEFSTVCQSKQVNLEARVALSTSVGRGLIQEANFISAQLLIIGSSRSRYNRYSREITRHCFEQAPEECSVVSVAKSWKLKQDHDANLLEFEEVYLSDSRWSKKNIDISLAQKFMIPNTRREKPLPKWELSKTQEKANREKPSPKRVLDGPDGESQSTEEDSISVCDSSTAESPSLVPILGGQSNRRKQMSKLKIISSMFRLPFDTRGRKRNGSIANIGKHQPLLKCFSYEEISRATNNFHQENIVGRGGYSEVYRGDLTDGRTIAVKRLSKDNSDADKEKEFLMEIGIIGHVCHPNTAILVGCCIENGLHLIFHFSPNGTLESALHGKTSKILEWPDRYKIAVGVARGLHYLHKCCKHRIIHRDIKASNVLLGPDNEPQIADFGLAKWLPNKWTHHAVIPIEGTFGYLAPEYFMHGIVDEKTDVFAFGILLLEIITGRRPVDTTEQNILYWAKPLLESGDTSALADPKLEGKYDMDQMRRVVLTASYCVRQSSLWRPSMTEVLELLRNDKGDSEYAKSWKMSKYMSDDNSIDDFSMEAEWEIPTDIISEDIY